MDFLYNSFGIEVVGIKHLPSSRTGTKFKVSGHLGLLIPTFNMYFFQRPKRRYLDGDIHAVKNGNPCLQPSPNDPKKVVGDEDCLTLNVYTPKVTYCKLSRESN